MRKRLAVLLSITAALVLAILLGQRLRSVQAANDKSGPSFAAVPGSVGGQDMFGAYDVVPDCPKPLATIPGNEKWTWGAGQSVFAESPNRVFILQRGELPNIERPKRIALPQLGPSIEFPIGRLPWRDATSSSPPGRLETPDGKLGDDSDVGKNGVDFNWAHCIVVVDANGNHIEDWTQWDKMLRRPHAVYISPYDPEKNVWIVDDYRHAIFKFTHDGKRLLQTIGEPNVHASDDKHFYRPTDIAWLPDGTFFVSDGYANTRVVKFDKNGKYLTAWGTKGTDPGQFRTPHSIAVGKDRRIYVADRSNQRIQIFDENGKFIDQWPDIRSAYHIFATNDQHL